VTQWHVGAFDDVFRSEIMIDRRYVLTTFGAGLLLAGVGRGFARTPGAVSCSAGDCSCGPTGPATAGPFYVSNAPATVNINLLNAPGTALEVAAIVLGGADGRSPLAGAKVELWHADSDGHYHPEADGDISRYRPDEINLRGQGVAGADGRLSFYSIVPGRYGNRRRHLHWRIGAAGHRTLVTQTYWRDEKDTPYERSDPVDRHAEDCRWIDFRTADAGVTGAVVFVLETAS
jgi:protocatechuate 3,4-dioxygenase beta subunit